MTTLKEYIISYAQNREDVIISGFFPDVETGTYVDVGANHPSDDSVTKFFYDKGWHGINIEPNRDLLALLERDRKRDTNIGVGISDKTDTIKFREYRNHGLSTFSSEIMKEYEGSHNDKTDEYEEYSVEVKTLRAVLEGLNFTKINFLKVDVEGFEYEVLKGNDWKKFRPELICIEANHIVKDWRPILTEADYSLAFNDGLNEYYIAKESSRRAKEFDYAKTMILSKPVISIHTANRLRNLLSVENSNKYLKEEYERLRGEFARLEKDYLFAVDQRNKLFGKLEQYSTLRKQIRSLASLLNKGILNRIESLNKPRQRHHAPVLRVEDITSKTTDQLLEIANSYDLRHLRAKSPYRNPNYLLYIVSKGTYGLVVRFLRGGIRLLRVVKNRIGRA